MKDQILTDLLSNGIFLIALPWSIWVSVSIFNQRQELALLKQILETLVKQGEERESKA
jgi:hypothetical protein